MSDFIRDIIAEEVAAGKNGGRVATRFPPEPNGYLHIGHAKALAINFNIRDENEGAICNLRFDDTNPTKEEVEYVDSILEDIRWLGYEWDNLFYASDYFEQLYEWAVQLIKDGKAYVEDLSAEEMREYRGTLTEPGRNSPYRDRSIEENLDLFQRMRAGEFADGERILRAKIDMSSPNTNLRDPAMYRILHTHHDRTGDKWCIYPMYDWAHGQSDSIEGITHSLCSLEYENHRPLYNWFVEQLGIFAPRQVEFARLNLTHTIMSKRKLLKLVESETVRGWDDPRMPTISGMRRRGYPASALRQLIKDTGVAKSYQMVQMQQLEAAVRDVLNVETPRVMGVLNPLKLIITNYPEGQTETFDLPNYPQDRENTETRTVPFSRELYIEREDFSEVPIPGFKRMIPERLIRLFGAYFVRATDVVKDEDGNIVAVNCTYDEATRRGVKPQGTPNPKATIHWVSAESALPATINVYESLFSKENPDEGGDFMQNINPNSLKVVTAHVEPSLASTQPGDKFQFMRMGYFATDLDSTADALVFNRTLPLNDEWAKLQKK